MGEHASEVVRRIELRTGRRARPPEQEGWSGLVLARGPCWAWECDDEGGSIGRAWGPLGTDDARAIARAMREHAPRAPRRLLIEFSVLGADDIGGATFREFLASAHTVLVPREWRIALVTPPGLMGVVLDAFRHFIPNGGDIRSFPTPAEAIAWLGTSPVYEHLAKTGFAPRPEETTVAEIRRALRQSPRLDLAAIAARLGTTTRTLQRRLLAVGASFRKEQERARMESAVEKVTADRTKIVAVAEAAGFRSVSQFFAAFKRYTGSTPDALRKQRLGEAAAKGREPA